MIIKKRIPPVIWLAKNTWGIFAKKHFKVSLNESEKINNLNGPALILSNHTNFYDPMFISVMFPFHIRWVAGAYLFKLKILKTLLDKGATCISKQQGRSDFSTIRSIQKALRNGDKVGLFPEGCRTWDGNYEPLVGLTTAKMLKVFHVPVVFINLRGGFAQKPRWADYTRKGPFEVGVESLLTPEEIKNYSVEELAEQVNKRLGFDCHEWQIKKDIHYHCKKNAEGIQRFLYLCPKCGGIQTISASNNMISCECGASGILTDQDSIESDDFNFHTLPDWHKWEKKQITKVDSFPEEEGVLFQKGSEGELKTISKKIKVKGTKQNLIITCYDIKEETQMEWSKITSLILNAKQTIELFYNDELYRIRLHKDSSSLKYQELYLGLRS